MGRRPTPERRALAIAAVLALAPAGCGGPELGRGKRTSAEEVAGKAPVAAAAPRPAPETAKPASSAPSKTPASPAAPPAGGVERAPWDIEPEAESYATWTEYQHDHRDDCAGRLDRLDEPTYARSKGRRVSIHGHWLTLDAPEDGLVPTTVKVGVVSALKDQESKTLQNLRRFVAWFEREGVALVLVNGDVAYKAEDMEATLRLLGESGFLVLVHAGNADPVGSFNLVLKRLSERYPNVVNGNLVRLAEIGPVTLLTLPGYHDPRYLIEGSGCQYYKEDVLGLDALAAKARATPVLVAHGPPRGQGKGAIDFAYDAGNVGDPEMNRFLDRKGVHFGVFGHILESGGRAVDPVGEEPVREGVWSERLWINVGAATSVGSDLLDGRSHAGMAAIVELDGQRARYWLDMVKP